LSFFRILGFFASAGGLIQYGSKFSFFIRGMVTFAVGDNLGPCRLIFHTTNLPRVTSVLLGQVLCVFCCTPCLKAS
jgi:hypothetical protein